MRGGVQRSPTTRDGETRECSELLGDCWRIPVGNRASAAPCRRCCTRGSILSQGFLSEVLKGQSCESGGVYGYSKCVLRNKVVFPPSYARHSNQCPCRCLLEGRALILLWSQTRRQIRIANTARCTVGVSSGPLIRRSGQDGIPIEGGRNRLARLGNCTHNLE